MKLEYVPLLLVQRDLYAMPRGYERFRAFLGTMIDPATADLELPLVAINPSGKDHLLPCIDQLLAIDADGAAAWATDALRPALAAVPGDFRVTAVVSDDMQGGWTNRYTSELAQRLGDRPLHQRGWATALLWTSETYTPERVAEELRVSLYRLAAIQQRGYPATLGELLAQEGYAMARAGATAPTLGADDRDYTRQVLGRYRDRDDQPTLIAALFGDPAAQQLGHPPLGLAPRAGLALALHDARAAG